MLYRTYSWPRVQICRLDVSNVKDPFTPCGQLLRQNCFTWKLSYWYPWFTQRVSKYCKRWNYLTMLSAITSTQWVFYIISLLPHIHIFTDVSIFGSFLTLYRNLSITKSSLCYRGHSKLQFSGSYVTISWEMASEISQMSDKFCYNHTRYSGFVYCCH